MERLGPALIAAAVGLAVAFALWSGSSVPEPVDRGGRAPDFALPRVPSGETLRLADLRGRVVLLNFWATWCKPCEEEMPAMQRLHAALADEGLELVAVSVDDEREAPARFAERLGLGFPILWDPEREVSGLYQASRFPETLLIDRDGEIVERYVGPREWDALLYQERLRKLLARDG